jgi:hypothetical protein
MELMIYLSMVIIGIIITNSFGYNITSHTISQFGSIQYTHLPIIFDLACVIGGLMTILLYCSLSKKIVVKKKRLMIKFSQYGVFIGTVGNFGIIIVGIFSLDRSGSLGLFHISSMIFAFGGYIISLFLYGVIILLKIKSRF